MTLEPGEMLYLPAAYFHATETLPAASGNSADNQASRRGSAASDFAATHADIGASANFFLSACFAAIGVIVPDLAEEGVPPAWLGGEPPPNMPCLGDAID